jgi:U4/U6.U5 tri-snRNP-associated protein 1
MAVDEPVKFEKRRVDDGPQNLVDDDDIQAALARARRESAKKKPKVKAEDIAARSESHHGLLGYADAVLVVSQREEDTAPQEENGDEDGRITFDDTSEFVRNVNAESRAAPVKRERAASPPAAAPQEPVIVKVKVERDEEGEVGEDEDMDSEDEDEALAEMAAREGLSLAEYREKIDSQMQEMERVKQEGMEVSLRIDDPLFCLLIGEQAASSEEPVMGTGMAGYLNMLKQQGSLKAKTAEDEERERVQKQKDLWMADYRRRIAQRELEKIQARGGNKDQAQREWEAKIREQNEARDALEIYKSYKPDINIVYHDEFGRGKSPAFLCVSGVTLMTTF